MLWDLLYFVYLSQKIKNQEKKVPSIRDNKRKIIEGPSQFYKTQKKNIMSIESHKIENFLNLQFSEQNK